MSPELTNGRWVDNHQHTIGETGENQIESLINSMMIDF